VTREAFIESKYADVFKGDEKWQGVETSEAETYDWPATSTYVQNPPYFQGMGKEPGTISNIEGARCWRSAGRHDHHRPHLARRLVQGNHACGQYLTERQVPVREFNSYGSRRGNHEVMMRGTFANIRIKNEMLDGVEGGYTKGPDGSRPRSSTRPWPTRRKARRWWSSAASNTARARRATGRRRARRFWASRP
jgi:aconitate hydratase